jgi:LacI family repressor for deo operon, udp, cdd, tsx, nupC, and nupG
VPTIHEVAKEAGVSPSTVSRSFTDSRLLTDETRERVLAVARRLNYRPPHVRAKDRAGSAGRRREAIAALGFQFFAPSDTATVDTDAFYAPVLAGAQAEAQELGLHLLVHTTTRHQLDAELPRMISEQAVAGLLLVGTADEEVLASFLAHVPRIVLVDNRDLTGRHDCVLSDGVGGAAAAVQYLFGLGHRRVAFAMSAPQTLTFQDRLTGYLKAHVNAGVPIDASRIVAAGPEDDFAARVQDLLARPERPTAVLAANDPHAYLVIQTCHRLGLRIPDDVSIMGFDDDKFSSLSLPPLTTMRVETEFLGRLAVRRLMERVRQGATGARPEPAINVEVPVSLVVRDSCRPR